MNQHFKNKITNNTDSIINIGHDFSSYSGNKQLIPLEPLAIRNFIKQLMILVDYDLNEIKNSRYLEYDIEGYLKSEF